MTIDSANRLLISSLTDLYGDQEAAAVCSLVMERITGLPKGLRLMNKTELLSSSQQELFQHFHQDLMGNRPVQYVLGEAWFGALPFYVDERVLIPRPETEELAEWLLKDIGGTPGGFSLLDIGTGSGCIPVFLYSKRKDLRLTALDISEDAIQVAKKNSATHHAVIEFFVSDIRDRAQWERIAPQDLIISNPPYIPEKLKDLLDKHVRHFEPPLALFVPNEDPILFYKLIGEFAIQKLKPGGALFLEIHHDQAKNIMDWYEKNGFTIDLKKDFSGNNRMIKARRR